MTGSIGKFDAEVTQFRSFLEEFRKTDPADASTLNKLTLKIAAAFNHLAEVRPDISPQLEKNWQVVTAKKNRERAKAGFPLQSPPAAEHKVSQLFLNSIVNEMKEKMAQAHREGDETIAEGRRQADQVRAESARLIADAIVAHAQQLAKTPDPKKKTP